MGTDSEWNTHYDRFRHCTHLGRSDLRPNGGIRIRCKLDPDGMGDLARSRTGITERRVGRAIGPAARLLLCNASVREEWTRLGLPRGPLVPAIATSCPVVCESSPSQIPAGRPTDHDSSHARSGGGTSHHIRCDRRYHVVGAGLGLAGHRGMAAAV
jgi:hypothetical protein